MRDTNAQRGNTMIPIGAMRQPPEPHVSHAETEGSLTFRRSLAWGPIKPANYDGQRCALLTTKSRNTCTRATVFSSSG